ncbi:MAG: TauD/TfdA family dioxygenase [Pseudomonadales bacterium]
MIGALGAEIVGVDLSSSLGAAVVAEIRQAWLEHLVVFFRDQTLAPDDQTRFAECFGELDVYPFVQPLEDNCHVIPIIKEPETRMNFGGGWHTDTSYLPKPPMATMLYALEVPERGGDTLFADTCKGYEAMSDGMKRLADSLTGIYSASMVHGKSGAYRLAGDHPMARRSNEHTAEARVEHPIVCTHPETGRKAIYCSLGHTERFEDMTREESLPLLQFFSRQATRAQFTTRCRWRKGSLALWDNRCVQHYALNDYPGERRHMHRVTIKGDAPV